MALAMLASASAARACINIAPFEIEDIRQADAVFTGQLVAYERVSPGRPGSLHDYGLLTVRVDEVIKGKVPKKVQLYWWNSTFGLPESLDIETPLLIGAVSAEGQNPPLRGGSATVFPTRRPDLLQLLQAPCSQAFLLDDTRQNVDNVRTILRGKSVPPHDYFAIQFAEARRPRAAADDAEAEATFGMTVLGGIVAVFAAIALAAWLVVRRKS